MRINAPLPAFTPGRWLASIAVAAAVAAACGEAAGEVDPSADVVDRAEAVLEGGPHLLLAKADRAVPMLLSRSGKGDRAPVVPPPDVERIFALVEPEADVDLPAAVPQPMDPVEERFAALPLAPAAGEDRSAVIRPDLPLVTALPNSFHLARIDPSLLWDDPGEPRPGGLVERGIASYYWQPQMTASGTRFDPDAMTAAHKTLPLGTKVRVTHQKTGKWVVVKINDRGPYIRGRIVDLSRAAAQKIGMTQSGIAPVTLTVLQ